MTRDELLEALLVERYRPLPRRPFTPAQVDDAGWVRLREAAEEAWAEDPVPASYALPRWKVG